MAQRILGIPMLVGVAVTERTLVKIVGNKSIGPCTAATDVPIGVAEFAGAAGSIVNVLTVGVVRVRAAAAIGAGSRITSNAAGLAVVAAPAAGVNNGILGIALEGAAALNDEFDVLLAQTVMQG